MDINGIIADLFCIWEDIGLPQNERLKIFQTLLDEENTKKGKLIQNIGDLGNRLCYLNENLKIEDPDEPEIEFNLLQLEKYLQERVRCLEEEEKRRLKVLQDLRFEEKELCERMEENVVDLPNEKIPSEKTMAFLRTVIKTLQTEKIQREKTLKGFHAAILAHMEDLDLKQTSMQRDLLSGVEGMVSLSLSNIREMKKLSKNLQYKVKENKERESFLQDQIQVLWERLNIDAEYRQQFFSSLTGKLSKDLTVLESELKDMEKLKRENIGHFITQLRMELKTSWEKCCIGKEERKQFRDFSTDDYSEEVLVAHEREVKKLQNFYQENEDIFKKLSRWHVLWNKVTELDEKAHDPNRLFGNRGCSLLQEEKERKRVNNELPRLEKDLESRIKVFEEDNGKQFLVYGRSLHNYIKNQWEEYNFKKQIEKQEKQEQRNVLLQKEARLGTKASVKRVNPSRSETLRNSKYLRMGEGERTPVLTRHASRNNLALRPDEQRMALRDNNQRKPRECTFNSSQMPTYSKFSEAIQCLSEQENVRSSVTPSGKPAKRFNPSSAGPRLPRGQPRTPTSTKMNPLSTSRRYPVASRTPTGCGPPRLPATLPRPAAFVRRRSTRLNASRYKSPSKIYGNRGVPSPVSRSVRSNTLRFTTPSKNKLSFLM